MSELKPITEFVKEPPKYLELEGVEIPAWVGNSANNSGYTYPKIKLLGAKTGTICITGLQKHYRNDGTYINYLDDSGSSRSVIVPNSFLARILSPEKFAEMEKKHGLQLARAKNRVDLSFTGTSGTDPEMFVEDKNGQLIPAFKFLGSKAEPYKADKYFGSPNNVYWDGFQAEFDVVPNGCYSGVADSIHYGLQALLKKAREFDKHAKLSIQTVFDLTPDMLAEGKPEHINFGCMPSLNAYGMKGLGLPGNEVHFRPAGGHMHLGFYDLKATVAKRVVKAMDAILGVACVSMFAQFDDPRRRQLYGLAGEYRLPKHGLEYRVLSNAWLMHPLISHIVFDLGRTAAMVGMKNRLSEWKCDEAETIRIINTCDVVAARNVLTDNRETLLRYLEVKYLNWWTVGSGEKLDPIAAAEYTYNVILNGAESVIENPSNIEANWNLLGATSLVQEKELDKSQYSNSSIDGTWRLHCDGAGKNVMFVFKQGLEKKKV
jgi:Phage phiEco32-like COOH.NH2 ligase-type 2